MQLDRTVRFMQTKEGFKSFEFAPTEVWALILQCGGIDKGFKYTQMSRFAGQPFRVPLQGVAKSTWLVDKGFNDPVRGARGHHQSVAELIHGLMMAGVDEKF